MSIISNLIPGSFTPTAILRQTLGRGDFVLLGAKAPVRLGMKCLLQSRKEAWTAPPSLRSLYFVHFLFHFLFSTQYSSTANIQIKDCNAQRHHRQARRRLPFETRLFAGISIFSELIFC